MKITFESEAEKTEVLVGLRTLAHRQHEGKFHGTKTSALWSGIRITVLEQAVACVEATPVSKP